VSETIWKRRGFRRTLHLGGSSDEAVTLAGHSFNKGRLLRRVFEGSPQFANGGVDAAFDIDVDAMPPQARADLFPADQLPLMFDEEDQQLQRDPLEFYGARSVPELKARDVEIKVSEGPPGAAQNPSASFYTRSLKLLIRMDILLQEKFRSTSPRLYSRVAGLSA
jgi:hypothetical protein